MSEASTAPSVRVAVLQGQAEVQLGVSGAYRIVTLYTDEALMEGAHLGTVTVRAGQSGVQIGSRALKVFGVRINALDNGEITVNRRPFRGVVDIIRDRRVRLVVVNEVDIEQYLRGVLHRETSDRWPIEALKAQAIVARTFALYQVMSQVGQDYHLTADDASQVYGGRWAERRRTTMAVAQTEGLVLTWQGRLFPAYYHSCCGGHTEASDRLWKIAIPPLAGVPDPHCRGTKHYTWTRRVPLAQVVEPLRRAGYQLGAVTSLAPQTRDQSGRMTAVVVTDADPTRPVIVPAKVFRSAVGSHLVRSLRCRVWQEGQSVIIQGFGWGHGVGLCQWGAMQMANRGRTADDIVAFYYPSAVVERYAGQPVVAEQG
jgi:stage II sporulation protein D